MSIRRVAAGAGERRKPPIEGAPTAEVLIGAEDDWPVAVLCVTVAPGGAMPEHDHGASETLVTPIAGRVRITDAADGTSVDLERGVVAAIPKGDRVRLENPAADEEAEVLVVLSPPDFARQVGSWPEAAAA